MTVRCRYGLQIVFNPSSFLITTNAHAIFISEVVHRWVYGQIYFQNTLLSGLKVQHIWSMLCCKDIWFSWTYRKSSILFCSWALWAIQHFFQIFDFSGMNGSQTIKLKSTMVVLCRQGSRALKVLYIYFDSHHIFSSRRLERDWFDMNDHMHAVKIFHRTQPANFAMWFGISYTEQNGTLDHLLQSNSLVFLMIDLKFCIKMTDCKKIVYVVFSVIHNFPY